MRIEDDTGADGIIDRVRSWQRDEAGRPLAFETEHDGDGVVTLRTTYLRVP